MATHIGITAPRLTKSPRRRKSRFPETVQKPRGALAARVKEVGAEKFALVCIDPAKQRSEWMMADYLGNILIQPQTLEHQSVHFDLAVQLVREAQQQHGIAEVLVTVERTGSYHLPPQRAFARAGFSTRVVHPFATKQFRLPADPGNKTDRTDLMAQHRAAVAGFGLAEAIWDETHRRLQLRIRHRRDLVEKSTALICQIREHLHLSLPGYAELFSDLFTHSAALAIARACDSPAAMLQLGQAGLRQKLREQQIRVQAPTLDKILAWACQAARQVPTPEASPRHALWTDLDDLRQQLRRRIQSLEVEIADDLVRTPYVRLMAIPGIGVVSAADFAGEMGPIANYANANAITGRSGLFPSRYQSDTTDHADGPLVRQANRSLRAAILRIADNLARSNNHFRGRAELARAGKVDERAIRVKIGKSFTRLAFAAVAGDQPLRHACCAARDSIIEKLREFHLEHGTSPAAVLAQLELCVPQLLADTRGHEALIVSQVLQRQQTRRRGPTRLAELLPAVLARLGVTSLDTQPDTTGTTAPN
jgi:transposase